MPQALQKPAAGERQLDRGNFNRLIGAVENLGRIVFDPHHFQVTWNGLIPVVRLRQVAGSASFSGKVYIGGVDTAITGTAAAYVKVDVENGTAAYDAGPPPSPFPDGIEWYLVANTYGDIHITRF